MSYSFTMEKSFFLPWFGIIPSIEVNDIKLKSKTRLVMNDVIRNFLLQNPLKLSKEMLVSVTDVNRL